MRRMIFGVFLMSFLFGYAQTSNCSCCTDEYRAFDFWVGEWEVTVANGTFAGNNTITKEQDGCILKENWRSATPGYTGTSTNYFNITTKKWEQLWIDNQGQALKLKGYKVANQMILSSDAYVGEDGENYSNRITWTDNEDGTVRQLWELLKNGEVNQVLFDGLYKPKN